jgi:CMP-N,N'-diacetyllegionaminic acid synthase
MIQDKSVLAIIPARGGSKGIARKNIRVVAGKPLIAWTIEEAIKSRFIDRVIVSSDDREIIEISRELGADVPFVRPQEMAKDDTPTITPIVDLLNRLSDSYDYSVLLQPTSPLRTVQDIDECIQICFNENAKACVSVMEVDRHPYKMCTIQQDRMIQPFFESVDWNTRRQELPEIYVTNGAVYVTKVEVLLNEKTFHPHKTASYIMSKECSFDIDDEVDIHICETLLNVRHKNK